MQLYTTDEALYSTTEDYLNAIERPGFKPSIYLPREKRIDVIESFRKARSAEERKIILQRNLQYQKIK